LKQFGEAIGRRKSAEALLQLNILSATIAAAFGNGEAVEELVKTLTA
jgi:hypothetical protein